MKKKLIPFALLFTYLLPLVGCGSKTCTITFDPNNGEDTFTITVNKGELLTEPESPEKTAYDFKAWRYNNIKWSFKYEKVKGDMTLVAYYAPIEYSIALVPGNAYLNSYTHSYTIESKIDKIAEICKPGYIVDYYIDQYGNHITSLNGLYGDKVLTPHWVLDEKNFVLYGRLPSTLVRDEALITTLDSLISSPTYYGDVTYEGVTYRRYNTGYKSIVDNTRVNNNTDIYLRYDPITWFKLYETENYTVCMSTFILDCYKPVLDKNLSRYSHSEIDVYVQGLVNEFFNQDEINGLYDFRIEDSTAKMFLPSASELNDAMDRLVSIPLAGRFEDMSSGVLSSRSYIENKGHTNMSASGGTINYCAGYYTTRTIYDVGKLKTIEDSRTVNDYGTNNLNIRPCIAIKK